ncbi:MAG: hypothetical protein ACYCTI_04145 [Acidimicrobiales bacterium]
MLVFGPKATFISWLTEIDATNGHPLAARVDLAMANHTIPLRCWQPLQLSVFW